jgi:probable F420-dependent oxidoreductase
VTSRPFRFLASRGHLDDFRQLVARARRAEALGYDALALSDHLMPGVPAPLPALVAAAEATTRLRVGTFVFNNDLRHPAVLAQELATVDAFSGGRLEIGLGAGWNRVEYERSGIPFDPIGTRVSRMEEAIRVLKGLLAGGPFSFAGQHYQISEMEGWETIQKPHPPLMIGGGGPRVLGIAGREAQSVSLAPRLVSPEQPDVLGCLAAGTEKKVEHIRAAAAGRYPEICTYAPFYPVTITRDRRGRARELADKVRRDYRVEVGEDDLLDSPHVFIGTVDELVEKCLAMRERFGITAVVVPEIEEFAPVVERLAGR